MSPLLQTTYRYRLAPTAKQERQLNQFAGARRWVWNWALARSRDHFRQTGTSLSFAALSAELTRLKQQPGMAWLRARHAQSLQQALRDLHAARANTHLVVIGRFFPSSKTCGVCGRVNVSLTRSERVWRCRCAAEHDRDQNAARHCASSRVMTRTGRSCSTTSSSRNRPGMLNTPSHVKGRARKGFAPPETSPRGRAREG
jgi:transposase